MAESRIAYVNLAQQHQPLKAELMEAVSRVMDHGQFILGEEVETFEKRFAELCGVQYAVGVNSGTDALILALRAVDVQPGDEVITVPNSFVATTACIRLLGARAIFVDVGDDYNIDTTGILAAVSSRTKAILPVHLTGRPCDMAPILALAHERNIAVVEDCAQAVMAEYRNQRVGSFGKIGCFSLHPLKTLNACGDGGVLTTDDPEIYQRLKLMRNLGLESRDHCVMWSHNSRLDTLQAAILLVKMRYLEEWTRRRRENASYYLSELAGIPGLCVPAVKNYENPVYHTFVVQAERREALRPFLESQGIDTNIHYPVPIHLSSAGSELGYAKGSFPKAERQAQKILSLPVYPELEPEHLKHIVSSLRHFYGA